MPVWKANHQKLECIPAVPEHISLPWDAADEILVNFSSHLVKSDKTPDEKPEAISPRLIIGDRYGALSTTYPDAAVCVDNVSAALAINKNRQANGLAQLSIQHDLDAAMSALAADSCNNDLEQKIVMARFPKQFEVLVFYTYLCARYHIRLVLAGMQKHLPVRWLNWLEKNSHYYHQSRIVKKARTVIVEPNNCIHPPQLAGYTIEDIELTAEPGVYGREEADPGALALIPHLPDGLSGRIADLGCGNGLLTILTKKRCPNADIVGIDDSYSAIKSARNNATKAGLAIQWAHSDIFNTVEGRFDTILCNPPFHDGHKLSRNIATNMFQQAEKALTSDGTLLVVANRHLPYFKALTRLFRVATLKSSDSRFTIYRCQK